MDIVSDKQLGSLLDIRGISLNNNGELTATNLVINFMSPVKDLITSLYIELKLPQSYAPMLQLWGTVGCSLQNLEGKIFASTCSFRANMISMKVSEQIFKEEELLLEIRQIVNPKVDGEKIFEMIQMGVSVNQN